MNVRNVGLRILGFMKMRCISLDEMALHMDISRSTLYRRLNDPDTLTLGELKQAAKLLKVSVTEILGKELPR